MEDIASESEFSKRTVYIYFKSKEQLYFGIMVRGYNFNLKDRSIFYDLKEKISLD